MQRYAIVITALLLLANCTHRPIPLATSYPLTAQRKMQSAHHWDVLAENVANRLKKTITLTFVNAPTPPPIYLRVSDDQKESPFGKIFQRLLANQLVNKGLVILATGPVSNSQQLGYMDAANYRDSLLVNFDMEVIYHKDRRATYPFPGTLTALAGGVWWVAHGLDQWEHPEAASIPLAVAADAFAMKQLYMPGETNAEVVITTTVMMNSQQIFGDTGIYYINAGDDDHYLYGESGGSGKTYSIIGCHSEPCP